jgi:hypothetical protein
MNKIQVTYREVYGQTTVYPVCEKAKAFADMVNQKTLTLRTLEHIQKLGFVIEVVDRFTGRPVGMAA